MIYFFLQTEFLINVISCSLNLKAADNLCNKMTQHICTVLLIIDSDQSRILKHLIELRR